MLDKFFFNSFRESHLLCLLQSFEESSLPLRLHVHKYFLNNKNLGSNDRRVITDSLYHILRWKNFFGYFSKYSTVNWKDIFHISQKINPLENDTPMPAWDRVSFPNWLYKKIVASLGLQIGTNVCYVLNTQAPLAIRINPIKTTRENFLLKWGSKYNLQPCTKSYLGLYTSQRISIQSIPSFHKGEFEVQDEGSQVMANLIKPNPGDIVLDYCAGSGGKSLVFAPHMKNKGKIYLYDTRKAILLEAKKRFYKSGIYNIKFFNPSMDLQCDWIVLDVPCSGTGTIRRQPEIKWTLSEEKIISFCNLQRAIFDSAWKYLKKDGKLVYITCSILQEENEDQLTYFIKKYPIQVIEKISLLPVKNGNDGFFGTVLKKL